MNNIVFKIESKEDAKRVIYYFISRGVNIRNYHDSTSNAEDGYFCHYYGVVNGIFGIYDISEIDGCVII